MPSYFALNFFNNLIPCCSPSVPQPHPAFTFLFSQRRPLTLSVENIHAHIKNCYHQPSRFLPRYFYQYFRHPQLLHTQMFLFLSSTLYPHSTNCSSRPARNQECMEQIIHCLPLKFTPHLSETLLYLVPRVRTLYIPNFPSGPPAPQPRLYFFALLHRPKLAHAFINSAQNASALQHVFVASIQYKALPLQSPTPSLYINLTLHLQSLAHSYAK